MSTVLLHLISYMSTKTGVLLGASDGNVMVGHGVLGLLMSHITI